MTAGAPGADALPVVHVVTDDAVLFRDDFVGLATDLMERGGPGMALHLRGPSTPGGIVERLGVALVPVRDRSGAWLVVNDRLDVALAVGADGAQVGRRSLSVPDARRVAPGLALGASVHGLGEARTARGADWLVVGTVWETPSHPGRRGGGLDLLLQLSSSDLPPTVAIGGVTPARVAEARRAGAAGVAVLRGVWAARDPLEALGAYLSAWNHA